MGRIVERTGPQRPRLGLCCTFAQEPIKFRQTTARYLGTLAPAERARFLGELLLHNAEALEKAVTWCADHGVGAFRVMSQLFPIYTHPQMGYRWTELPGASRIQGTLRRARDLAASRDVRLSFHPDQFVVLGSTNEATVASSVKELEYQAEVARLIGAVQLTVHGGGAQGGKPEALERLLRGLDRLSPQARALVVLENDDRVYTPSDLLPICDKAGLRFIYDVHHHRCLPDEMTVEQATDAAVATWRGDEPWFHVSSPAEGWDANDPRPHHDRLWLRDFPEAWRTRRFTVDVEAKGKERSVLQLAKALARPRPS